MEIKNQKQGSEMKAAHTYYTGLLLAVAFSLCESAEAAILTYDLTANPSYMTVESFPQPGGVLRVEQNFLLADATTGYAQQPAQTVTLGDTINGTINFTSPYSPVTSFFGETLLIQLQSAVGYGFGYIDSSLSFYNNGQLVDTPVHAEQGQSSFPYLGTSAFSSGVTPVHTFDKIVFSTTVSRIYSQSFQDVPSVNLVSGTAQLKIWSLPAPVPLPAGFWLLVSGMSGLGYFARRKRTVA